MCFACDMKMYVVAMAKRLNNMRQIANCNQSVGLLTWYCPVLYLMVWKYLYIVFGSVLLICCFDQDNIYAMWIRGNCCDKVKVIG